MHPFLSVNYPNSGRLHQDNDAKHNSKLCKKAMYELGINWVSSISINKFKDTFITSKYNVKFI